MPSEGAEQAPANTEAPTVDVAMAEVAEHVALASVFMMFVTRLARLYDSACLADLWRSASAANRRASELSARPVMRNVRGAARHQQRLLHCLAQPRTFAVLGEDDDDLVAMVLATPARAGGRAASEPSTRLAHVSMLAVRPDRWGEGLGGAVLKTVQTIAGEQGFSRAQLWTQETNQRARRLYRRLGWQATKRTMVDENGEISLHYVRNI